MNYELFEFDPKGTPDSQQAAYWNGYMSRKEVQNVLDPISDCIRELITNIHGDAQAKREGLLAIIAKLDMTVAFLMDRLGYTPEEFQKFITDKLSEFQSNKISGVD